MMNLPKKQVGVSLIELMISITIGVLILSGIVQLYSTSRNNSLLNSGQSVIQDNLRYLISQLEEDAGQAGNVGCFSLAFRQYEDTVNDIYKDYMGDILAQDNEDEVAGTVLRRYNVGRMIDGIDNNGVRDTDSVLFRYAPSYAGIPVQYYKLDSATPDQIVLDLSTATAKLRFAEIDQYDVLLAADCRGALYFMVTNDPTDTPGDTEILEFKAGVTAPSEHINAGQQNRVEAFSTVAKLEDINDPSIPDDDVVVGNWDESGAGGVGTRPYVYSSSDSRAVIYRIGDSQMAEDLGQSCTADTPEYCALLRDDIEIADGVEDFQIEYGWHVNGDENGAVRFGDASQVPNDQWNFIDRIRVALTLNSINPISTPNGSQLVRRSYVRTIALRNQVGDL